MSDRDTLIEIIKEWYDVPTSIASLIVDQASDIAAKYKDAREIYSRMRDEDGDWNYSE